MKWSDYIRDKIEIIGVFIISMFFLLEFLYLVGNERAILLMIGMTGTIIFTLSLVVHWYRRNTYIKEIQRRMEELKEPWLIGEILPFSERLEDKLNQEWLQNVGKKALEYIHKVEDEQSEYEEYIEEWIHEVKTPLTTISLLIENGKIEDVLFKKTLKLELKKIEHDVEKALYYARCNEVYKDYLRKRINLYSTLVKIIQQNRLLLMSHSMMITVDCDKEMEVVTDEKWLTFLVTQIFLNCVKYRKNTGGNIELYAQEEKGGTVVLSIQDNGIGIKQEEIKRVFEKGFTGTNGRNGEDSTGMGLYIVKKICDKMGILVWVESEYGVYTKVNFII